MKKKSVTMPAHNFEKTSPILLRALELMKLYARATGARITVHDHNYMVIPEQTENMLCEKNVCLFCLKHQNNVEAKCLKDLIPNPCREMHINAIKESHRYGGSYMYACKLGFMFWTSPIYTGGAFSGALMGSGFLGTNRDETSVLMHNLCKGAVSKADIKKMLCAFPAGDSIKFKALAELLLICAQSLSTGCEQSHESMRRRAKQQIDLTFKLSELKSSFPPGSDRPGYSMDREKKLLKALHRGDIELGRQILNEILAALCYSNPDQFKNIQYRAIELSVLMSRIETGSGFQARTILESNNRHIKQIQETNGIEELIDVLNQIIENLAGQVMCFQGINHASALKKAERYILENFTRKLSLDEVSKASGFSAPYFSTIFKDEMGENFSCFLNRLRVKKAGEMLSGTNYSLCKIARACGFEDQSWFSKIFKSYTGFSPGKYRNQGENTELKIPETGFSDDYLNMIKEKETV
jgi:AraC-like DNA-binding protein/ligand-binding sensor protein